MAVTEPHDPFTMAEEVKKLLLEQIEAASPSHMNAKNANYMYRCVQDFDFTALHPEEEWDDLFRKIKSFDQFGTMQFSFRHIFNSLFSYSIPTMEALHRIKELVGDRVVKEYMAGTGYWAHLMQKVGIQVIATDMRSETIKSQTGEHASDYGMIHKNYIPMEEEDIANATADPNQVIMLSWVPYASSIANNLLKTMSSGQMLILIGESSGGCTGDDEMFDILGEHFNEIEEIDIPQFYGIHDAVFIYQKN